MSLPAHMHWFVLGFAPDDVVTAEQDARLADELTRALRDLAHPPGFQILVSGGDDRHLILWYVSAPAAELLDRLGVHWRRFVIGDAADAPATATPLLLPHPSSTLSA